MNTKIATGALVALAITGGFIREASATWPAGVWTHVDKIVYDNPAKPSKIEIHGAFMLHNGDASTKYPGYSNPALGYMYFACPAGEEATCQMEWADLEKNIGAPLDQCLGFGGDMLPTGTLRDECDPPANPDQYPISMGVAPAFSPCQVLQAFLKSNPGPDGGCGSSSSSASSSASSTAASSGSGGAASGASSSATGPASSAASGAGGGASSGGNNGSGCSVEAAPQGSIGLFGLAIPILGAGIAVRRRAARARAR